MSAQVAEMSTQALRNKVAELERRLAVLEMDGNPKARAVGEELTQLQVELVKRERAER